MKKVMALGIVLVLWMATSAWADNPWCTVCPSSGKATVCAPADVCPDTVGQEDCAVVDPCNAVLEICECVDPVTNTTIFRENNAIGVQITSNTKGVYLVYGAPLQVKLFAEDELDEACNARTDSTLEEPNYEWDPVNSLYYLDASGDPVDPTGDGCDDKITTISTCVGKDQLEAGPDYPAFWTIDYLKTDAPWATVPGDNDNDGEAGEDITGYYGHLVVSIPSVAIDWDDVDEEDLGSTATVTVSLIQLEDLDSLCPSCNVICSCDIAVATLCEEKYGEGSNAHCIYFPYALYNAGSWDTGMAITNTSEGDVPVDEMAVTVTIVDSLGKVTSKEFSDFTSPIQAFLVSGLVDTMLGVGSDVADGALYVKFDANFPIDGYAFHFLFDGDTSAGAGEMARQCGWPAVPYTSSMSDAK